MINGGAWFNQSGRSNWHGTGWLRPPNAALRRKANVAVVRRVARPVRTEVKVDTRCGLVAAAIAVGLLAAHRSTWMPVRVLGQVGGKEAFDQRTFEHGKPSGDRQSATTVGT